MHVDNILAGMKHEDLKQEAGKQPSMVAGMAVIKEEKHEVTSQSSAASMPLEDILVRGRDPRRNKAEPIGLAKIVEQDKKLSSDDLKRFKQNQDFFR